MEAISGLLERLLAMTQRQRVWGRTFFADRGPRTGWILVPEHRAGNFSCIHSYPEAPAYRGVRDSHCPAIWKMADIGGIDDELKKARRDLQPKALKAKEAELKTKLRGCASLTGYVFEYGGPRLFPKLDQVEADGTYLALIPEVDRHTHQFRSGAGIPIEFGGTRLGVLMLYDTLPAGYLGADAASISIFADLLAPFVATALGRNRITRSRRP